MGTLSVGWRAGRRAVVPSAGPVHRAGSLRSGRRECTLRGARRACWQLPEPCTFPNPGRYLAGGTLCRLRDNRKATSGHPLELAEAFMDPETHHGTVNRASNWAPPVGLTKGYASGRSGAHGSAWQAEAHASPGVRRCHVLSLCSTPAERSSGSEHGPPRPVACSLQLVPDTVRRKHI